MSATPPSAANAREARSVRRALLLILVGLVPTLICAIEVTPTTFVAFAVIGMPLIGVGVLVFLRAVWRVLREREAL